MEKHLPNIITGVRLALTPLFVYFILQGEYMHAVVTFIVIGVSDISDGAVARALGACTHFGACMDVFSDLLFILTSLIVLNVSGLAPVWFTLAIALKFVEFSITSLILKKGKRNGAVWEFDVPGRWFAFLTFLTPGVLCLAASILRDPNPILYFLLISVCTLAVVSSACRIVRCIPCLKLQQIGRIIWKRREVSVLLHD